MITELEVFPQVTNNEGQGLVGTRRWSLDHDDDIEAFRRIVCKSHWPGKPDCIPIQVQSGGFWDGVGIKRDSSTPRTYESLGDLPKLGKYLVVAQYALHRMTNCWPNKIPKPNHPKGTTLNLKVRGSGQMLMVSPAGVAAGFRNPICTPGTSGYAASVGTRIIMPLTEYHISCDRMKLWQVNNALLRPDWDMYQGTVNNADFLGAKAGTLLFDGYELTETYACDEDDPVRYCMSAVLKQRVILDELNNPLKPKDFALTQQYVGWNYDYIAMAGDSPKWDWLFIKIWKDGDCLPRYPPQDFSEMFMIEPDASQTCGQDRGSETTLGDCDLCGTVAAEYESGGDETISSIMPPEAETQNSSPSPSSSSSSSSSNLHPCDD